MSYFQHLLVCLFASPFFGSDDPKSSTADIAPSVIIEARQPGISPSEMVQTVAIPLEKALGGIEGVRRLSSLSQEGSCSVRLDLQASTDSKKVREASAKRLADAKSVLPEDCVRQRVRLLPETSPSFFVIALHAPGTKELLELTNLARDSIRPRLQRLPNVSQVPILGEANERVRIVCDPNRLVAFDVSIADVLSKLKKSSDRPPKRAQELEDLVVAESNGQAIYVRDLAVVQTGVQWTGQAGIITRGNKPGQEGAESAVLLFLQPSVGRDSNPSPDLDDLGKSLNKSLKEMAGDLPLGVRPDLRLFRPGDITMAVRLPPGSNLEERARLARTVAEACLRVPQLQGAYWYTAADNDDILLFPWPQSNAVASPPDVKLQTDLRSMLKQLAQLRGMGNRVVRLNPARSLNSSMVFWPGEGSQVAIRVSGDQLHQIRQTADQLLIRLSEIDGVVDLHSSIMMKPRVDIQVDRRKCTSLGLKLADVMQIIKMYQEGIEVEGLKIAGRPAFLMLLQSERNSVIGLGELSLTNGMGQRVPLRTVAAAQPLDGPRSVYREAGKNCIVVSCNIHGRTLAQVRQEVRKIAQELSTKEARIQVE